MHVDLKRNYYLNRSLVKIDTVASITLMMFFVFFTKSLATFLMPLLMFFLFYIPRHIYQLVSKKHQQHSLPPNIRTLVSSVIAVPRNVIFMRSRNNDCGSISLFVVHIVLLPEFFENDLQNPNKQAILLHEFAHGSFTDYLSVGWIWFACFLIAYISFQYFWALDGGEVRQLLANSHADLSLEIPLLGFLIICGFDSVWMLHRREINADFGAFFGRPKQLVSFLEYQKRKNKYFKIGKWQFETKLKNWFLHPTYEHRLSVVTGRIEIRSISILFPAILAGICPTYILFVLIGSVYTSTNLDAEIASVVTLPLSIYCLVQLGIALNDFYGNKSILNSMDKFMLWLGMLIGYEFFVVVLLYAVDSNGEGQFVVTASNGEIVTLELQMVIAAVFMGHVLFFLHSKLSALVTGRIFLGMFATPAYAFVIIALIAGIQMTGSVDIKTVIGVSGVAIAVSIFLMLVLEILLHKVTLFASPLYIKNFWKLKSTRAP